MTRRLGRRGETSRKILAGGILGFASSLCWSGTASALDCGFRQEFFSETSRGSLAYVKNATSAEEGRAYYANWCNVGATDKIAEKKGRYVFAINNRHSVKNDAFFAVIKIFRKGPSSAIRPFLSLSRVGTWVDKGPCPFSTFSAVRSGWPRYSDFNLNPAIAVSQANIARATCDPISSWNGAAFGVLGLELGKYSRFIRNVPPQVASSDIRQWSVNMTAYAYGTVSQENRRGRFPIIMISRDDEVNLVVEYFDSDGTYRTFEISTS